MPSVSIVCAAGQRAASFLEGPAIAGVATASIALGATLYIAMLLMSFDFGMRLRDIDLAHKRESEAIQQMEVRSREQEAGFAERHKILLHTMQEITALKYLTPENTALSAARGNTLFRP